MAQLVVALMIAFVALGLAWYGFSAEVRERIWRQLVERPGRPMTFRFILQPIMATIAALYDGVADARTGRSPYLWTILSDRTKRGDRLSKGLISARVILLGMVMDLIYQVIEFKTSILPRRSSSRSCSRLSPTCCCAVLVSVSRARGCGEPERLASGVCEPYKCVARATETRG